MENRFFLLRIFYIKSLTQDTIDQSTKISSSSIDCQKNLHFVIIVLLKPSIHRFIHQKYEI